MVRFFIPVLIVLLTMLPVFATDPDGPVLPSRDAAVVVTLLKGFRSDSGGPATVTKILGKPEAETLTKEYHERLYNLDDGTIIRVRESGTIVFSIFLHSSDAVKIQILYALNKKWRRP